MATLVIDERDLDDVTKRDSPYALRHRGVYPAVAATFAGLVYPLSTHVSALALGAALAWFWSLALAVRRSTR